VESCLVEAAALERDTGERIVRDRWRTLLPLAGGSKAAAFFPIGKNKPRPSVAEAGTAAPLRAAPARHCDGAVRVGLYLLYRGRLRKARSIACSVSGIAPMSLFVSGCAVKGSRQGDMV